MHSHYITVMWEKNLLERFDDNIICRAAFIQDVNVTGYTSGFKDFISQLYKCWSEQRRLPVVRARCSCQTVVSPCCSDAATPHIHELMVRGRGAHPCCCWSAASGSRHTHTHKIYKIRSKTHDLHLFIHVHQCSFSRSRCQKPVWFCLEHTNASVSTAAYRTGQVDLVRS